MDDVLLVCNVVLLTIRFVDTVIEVVTVVAVEICKVVIIELEVLFVDPIVTVAAELGDVIAPLDVL